NRRYRATHARLLVPPLLTDQQGQAHQPVARLLPQPFGGLYSAADARCGGSRPQRRAATSARSPLPAGRSASSAGLCLPAIPPRSSLALRYFASASVSEPGPSVQRQAAVLLGEEMKRAGRVLYPGRPALVWRVYFGTWEGEGSRASRRLRPRGDVGTAAGA